MKKIINTDAETDNIITEESFQYILIEIIDDVIEKRKEIHQRYQRLVKKVLSCQKSANRKNVDFKIPYVKSYQRVRQGIQ